MESKKYSVIFRSAGQVVKSSGKRIQTIATVYRLKIIENLYFALLFISKS